MAINRSNNDESLNNIEYPDDIKEFEKNAMSSVLKEVSNQFNKDGAVRLSTLSAEERNEILQRYFDNNNSIKTFLTKMLNRFGNSKNIGNRLKYIIESLKLIFLNENERMYINRNIDNISGGIRNAIETRAHIEFQNRREKLEKIPADDSIKVKKERDELVKDIVGDEKDNTRNIDVNNQQIQDRINGLSQSLIPITRMRLSDIKMDLSNYAREYLNRYSEVYNQFSSYVSNLLSSQRLLLRETDINNLLVLTNSIFELSVELYNSFLRNNVQKNDITERLHADQDYLVGMVERFNNNSLSGLELLNAIRRVFTNNANNCENLISILTQGATPESEEINRFFNYDKNEFIASPIIDLRMVVDNPLDEISNNKEVLKQLNDYFILKYGHRIVTIKNELKYLKRAGAHGYNSHRQATNRIMQNIADLQRETIKDDSNLFGVRLGLVDFEQDSNIADKISMQSKLRSYFGDIISMMDPEVDLNNKVPSNNLPSISSTPSNTTVTSNIPNTTNGSVNTTTAPKLRSRCRSRSRSRNRNRIKATTTIKNSNLPATEPSPVSSAKLSSGVKETSAPYTKSHTKKIAKETSASIKPRGTSKTGTKHKTLKSKAQTLPQIQSGSASQQPTLTTKWHKKKKSPSTTTSTSTSTSKSTTTPKPIAAKKVTRNKP